MLLAKTHGPPKLVSDPNRSSEFSSDCLFGQVPEQLPGSAGISVVWMFGEGTYMPCRPTFFSGLFLLLPMLIIATNTRTPFFTSTSCAQALGISSNPVH